MFLEISGIFLLLHMAQVIHMRLIQLTKKFQLMNFKEASRHGYGHIGQYDTPNQACLEAAR